LGAILTETRRDTLLVSVFLWAFVGVALKHSSVAVVGTSAWVAVALTTLLLVRGVMLLRRNMQIV